MNRKSSLEYHILSRSYSSELKVLELLESRYSLTGSQKPTLILTPTETKEKDDKSDRIKTPKKHITSTRNEFKTYIKQTMKNQKKASQYIKQQAKLNHLVNIDKLIKKYNIPQSEDFRKLNELWNGYINNLLGVTATVAAMTQKLSAADFNGCEITVLQSKNPNLVGMKGVIMWDSQYSFIIVVARDSGVGGLRILPKNGCVFSFRVVNDVESVEFSIIGSRFEIRSVDRANKKLKNHNVDDLV